MNSRVNCKVKNHRLLKKYWISVKTWKRVRLKVQHRRNKSKDKPRENNYLSSTIAIINKNYLLPDCIVKYC